MKKIISTVLTGSFLCFGSLAIGQAPVAQSDQIIDSDTKEIIQAERNSTGRFEAATVHARANSDVKLQFSGSLASKKLAVAALDGGTLTSGGGTSSIGADGSLSFSFQVSDQPGLHRVIVIDPKAHGDSPYIIGVVQFEVPSLPAD
jgi:hypothetical protein